MRHQIFAGFLFMTLCTGSAMAESKTYTAADFIGTWSVDQVIGYGDISGGVPYAKKMLGKTIIVTANSIKFGKEACTSKEKFSVSQVDSAKSLEENYGARRRDLEFPETVTQLGQESCGPIYKIDDSRIVYGQTGVIFRAVKQSFPAKTAP